jgi:hypothetical protein
MRLFARKSGTVGDPRLAQGPTAVIIAHYRVAMVNRPPPPRIVPRRQFPRHGADGPHFVVYTL